MTHSHSSALDFIQRGALKLNALLNALEHVHLSVPRRALWRDPKNALRHVPLNEFPSWENARFHVIRYVTLQRVLRDAILHGVIPIDDAALILHCGLLHDEPPHDELPHGELLDCVFPGSLLPDEPPPDGVALLYVLPTGPLLSDVLHCAIQLSEAPLCDGLLPRVLNGQSLNVQPDVSLPLSTIRHYDVPLLCVNEYHVAPLCALPRVPYGRVTGLLQRDG